MTKKELKAMSNAELIWAFAIWSTGKPNPTKTEVKTIDMLMHELDERGFAKYDELVAQGEKLYIL